MRYVAAQLAFFTVTSAPSSCEVELGCAVRLQHGRLAPPARSVRITAPRMHHVGYFWWSHSLNRPEYLYELVFFQASVLSNIYQEENGVRNLEESQLSFLADETSRASSRWQTSRRDFYVMSAYDFNSQIFLKACRSPPRKTGTPGPSPTAFPSPPGNHTQLSRLMVLTFISTSLNDDTSLLTFSLITVIR